MAKTLKRGDRVAWNTSRGKTSGTVVKKLTKPSHIKKTRSPLSNSEPQYVVHSAKSGDKAAHRKSALKKI